VTGVLFLAQFDHYGLPLELHALTQVARTCVWTKLATAPLPFHDVFSQVNQTGSSSCLPKLSPRQTIVLVNYTIPCSDGSVRRKLVLAKRCNEKPSLSHLLSVCLYCLKVTHAV